MERRSSFSLEVITLFRYKERTLYLLVVRAKNWDNATCCKKFNTEKSCLNMSRTRTIAIEMPKLVEERSLGLSSTQKNCSQIRNAKSKRNHFPYGAADKWVIQYQIVSHTLHTGGAVHSEQVILSNMNVYTYMNVMTMKGRAMNLILSAGLVLRAK